MLWALGRVEEFTRPGPAAACLTQGLSPPSGAVLNENIWTEERGDTVYCPGLTTLGGCSIPSFKNFPIETLKTSTARLSTHAK